MIYLFEKNVQRKSLDYNIIHYFIVIHKTQLFYFPNNFEFPVSYFQDGCKIDNYFH